MTTHVALDTGRECPRGTGEIFGNPIFHPHIDGSESSTRRGAGGYGYALYPESTQDVSDPLELACTKSLYRARYIQSALG